MCPLGLFGPPAVIFIKFLKYKKKLLRRCIKSFFYYMYNYSSVILVIWYFMNDFSKTFIENLYTNTSFNISWIKFEWFLYCCVVFVVLDLNVVNWAKQRGVTLPLSEPYTAELLRDLRIGRYMQSEACDEGRLGSKYYGLNATHPWNSGMKSLFCYM